MTCQCSSNPQFPRLTATQGLFSIASLGVFKAEGADALDFLHGQFTNRIKPLGSRAPLAAYCNPKGRIFATMRVFSYEGAAHLIAPKSVAPQLMKRLTMYVLRSDVKIGCAFANRALIGAIGQKGREAVRARLGELGLELPQKVDEAVSAPNLVVIRVADAIEIPGFAEAGERYLVFADGEEVSRWTFEANEAPWWASEAAAGIATVFGATQERFVPQGVNYELVAGVVFNKGCYPGQEVVSRLQHMGTPSRRMVLLKSSAEVALTAGDVILADGAPAGDTVFAVTGDAGTLALASLPIADACLTLTSEKAPEATFELTDLPYAFRNVLKD